jgi:5-methylcytosine-specific restriction endonuclease McrA
MAIVIINSDNIKNLKHFKFQCNNCNSTNVELEIDWAAYPSAAWNNITIICKDCHADEIAYESV